MKDELIGLSIIEECIVKCGDCGTPLVEIVKTEENSNRVQRGQKIQKSKYKVKCPKCNGFSFDTKIFEGSTIVGSIKDNYTVCVLDTELLDYNSRQDITNGNVVVYTTLELVEKK